MVGQRENTTDRIYQHSHSTNNNSSTSHAHAHPHHSTSSVSTSRRRATARPSELFSAEALQQVVRPIIIPRKKNNPSVLSLSDNGVDGTTISATNNLNLDSSTITIKDIRKRAKRREFDAIGDQVAELLNAHADFRFDAARIRKKKERAFQENQAFTWSPLFSRQNIAWLRHRIQRLQGRIRRNSTTMTPFHFVLSLLGFCYEITPSRQKVFTAATSSFLLFLSVLGAGLSLVIYASHVALVWSCREAVFMAVQLAMFLVDWNELEKSCPTLLRSIIRQGVGFCQWLDQHLFLAKRYAGREWNKDDFDFSRDARTAQSRHTELWSLPPPCIQDAGPKLCLDQRYMSRDEWSQSTSKHIVGINFCYIMMREEYSRKRARRSTVFHLGSQLPMMSPGKATPTKEFQSASGAQPINTRTLLASRQNEEEHTEHVFGLQSSPSGGIELVRENQGSQQKLKPGKQDSSSSFEPETGAEGLINDASLRLLADTKMHDNTIIKSDGSDSCRSSVGSCSSAKAADMNWVDISARIGMQVLNSAHLQRVVASQDTAERIKDITQQFVVSPRNKNTDGRIMPYDLSSPGETLLSASATCEGKKTKGDKLPQSLPRSLNRPVHSMWTSASAAGAFAEEENSSSSDDLRKRETSSFENRDASTNRNAPHAPPRIIRTREFPSISPEKQNHHTSVSPIRDWDVEGTQLQTEDLGTSELVHGSTSNQEEEAYEIIDQGCRTYSSPSDSGSVREMRPRSCSRRSTHTGEIFLCQREPLAPGVKIAAPMFPLQPGMKRIGHSNYQLATVVASKRIFVEDNDSSASSSLYGKQKNCLSVRCKIDKSFLRNGEFAEITFRVMDKWSSRYMPKHSKVPVGACVATMFGLGVVVGWRVEDDCHVVRSLWQRRGSGSAHAYLNRDAIHGVVEAAIGFDVMTKCGSGKVVGYVNSGPKFLDGQYTVTLQDDGVYKNCEISLPRKDIYSCYGAQFIPVIEYIKEACDFQIMLDTYNSALRQQNSGDEEVESEEERLWKFWSGNLGVVWGSFLKAVEEDSEFDEGVDTFMGSIIDFLERLDRPSSKTDTLDDKTKPVVSNYHDDTSTAASTCGDNSLSQEENEHDAGFWILDDFFGGVFASSKAKKVTGVSIEVLNTDTVGNYGKNREHLAVYRNLDHFCKRAFAIINTLMRTVSLARAASSGQPRFKLALTICSEFLMFVRTLIKVQQRNVSPQSLLIWKESLEEIKSTFGPMKERFQAVGKGIARRMEQQGRKAKIKVLRFADSILMDEVFLNSLCAGQWEQCLLRIEDSLVKAKIIDEASCGHYRKTVRFLYEHLVLLSSKESSAAERNNEKLAKLAKLVQLIASPKRSFLQLLRSDDVLETLERILVRVFCREKEVSRMLTIHASNFKSLRHLRTLKDLSVAGRLWIPILDAADEEFSYVVSKLPENAKEFMCPLSSIFSLCVAQFHKIAAGHSTKDWLDFLLEEDGVRIIHDIDMKAIQALSSFSRDIKDMMVILPYYPSIDDDILKLMDEVELDQFLKEASEAIDDADKLAFFIRDKATTAIERFLVSGPPSPQNEENSFLKFLVFIC